MYSVILPTVNEAENIPYVIELIVQTFKQYDYEFEIIVVDDASTDGTSDTVCNIQKLCPDYKIRLLERPSKLGLGTAYFEGFKLTKGKFIIVMDADLSHHPKYILDMIRKQKDTDADVVSCTRYSAGGGVSGWSLTRMVISRMANLLIKFIFWPKLTDLTGSYRLYKRNAFEKLLGSVKCTGFGFQMEAAVLSEKKFKFNVEQVPIVFIERIYGNSKLSNRD